MDKFDHSARFDPLAIRYRHAVNKHHPLVSLLYTEVGLSVLLFLGEGTRDIKVLQCSTRYLDDVQVFFLKVNKPKPPPAGRTYTATSDSDSGNGR